VRVVRLRRKAPAPEVVAVTGAASGVGRALVERLASRTDLAALLGLDLAPARVDGVVWRSVDLGDPALPTRLRGVTTLVHLDSAQDLGLVPAVRRAVTVERAEAVLAAARELDARVVLCTGAEVYGARADHPVPLPDGTPLCPADDDATLVADHLEVEHLVTQARSAGVDVTVLRPALLVGLPAAYDAARLRQLAAPRLLAVRGIEPLWQLCHLEDLVSALELAVLGLVGGDLGVAAEGAMSQAAVERLAGKRRLELTAAMARSTAERLRRLGGTTSPGELDHVLGHLVLECDGLRAAGWTPLWSNEAALEAHLRARSGDARTVAYTAAGATVAILGTAAIVRQARRRRRI
jgi:nucleoside-diphosphate-sugar epimerase